MTHIESDVFNLINNNYMVNEKEVLCAAYLDTPSKVPDNYLMINSFIRNDFLKFTVTDEQNFLKSDFSALNEKPNFLRFLNYSHKISHQINSKYNIREEKYKNKDWEGVLFFIPKADIRGRIGIELYYDRNVSKIIQHPLPVTQHIDFSIRDVSDMLSKNEEFLWLHLTHKFIVK